MRHSFLVGLIPLIMISACAKAPSGGEMTATIAVAGVSNVDTSEFKGMSVAGNYAQNLGASFSGSLSPEAGKMRSFSINISDRPEPGKSFTFPSKGANNIVNVLKYVQDNMVWEATTGTLTVESVSGKTVTFNIQATMEPNPDLSTGSSVKPMGGFGVVLTARVNEVKGF